MGGTEFRVQSSEFRTEARSTQRFFNDLSDLLSVSFVISVRSENGMGGTEFRVQSSEFRTEARRAQRFFNDLSDLLSVSFLVSVGSKTAWEALSSEFRVQSSEFRVSHGGTEYTEGF